jgi:hypothetical protein
MILEEGLAPLLNTPHWSGFERGEGLLNTRGLPREGLGGFVPLIKFVLSPLILYNKGERD